MIVVNYRTAELTIGCVSSLLESAGVDLHIVVVDNASCDDSAQRLQQAFQTDARVTIVARSVNDGYAGGNNAGAAIIRESAAEFALILNSDTILEPHCIARLVDAAKADQRIAIVVPRIFFADRSDALWFAGAKFSLWHGLPAHVGFRRTADRGWSTPRDLPFATGCAMLVSRAALDHVGELFDPSLFAYAEDLDLSLRLRSVGWRLRYEPGATVWHLDGASHRRAGGQALRFYLNTRNLLRVVARHARWYHWTTLAPLLAVDVIGRFCAVAVRDRDPQAFAAVLRGALHAITGGRHRIEPVR